MTSAARFGFDNDFTGDARGHDRIVMTRQEWQAALDDCASCSHARGVAEGRAAEAAAAETMLAAALLDLGRTIGDQMAVIEERMRAGTDTAVRIATVLARKIACRIEEQDPFGGIEQAFRALLLDLRQEPDLTVTVAPALVGVAAERLGALCAQSLPGLRLCVVDDATLHGGACRIEWAGGGLIRNPAAIDASLEAIIERTLGPAQKEVQP